MLINVKAGHVKDTMKELHELKGVHSVHACWGRPDLIAFLEVPDQKSLQDLVLQKIHHVAGVEGTDTHIVMDL